MNTPIDRMRNLGPAMRSWLAEAGISSAEELREAGAVTAFVRLRFIFGRRITLNALYALDAALADRDWREIIPERKAKLRAAVDAVSRFTGGP